MGYVITAIVALLAGIAVGVLIEIGTLNQMIVGNLRVDNSEQEPVTYLELFAPVDKVAKNRYIILKVKNKDWLPRK